MDQTVLLACYHAKRTVFIRRARPAIPPLKGVDALTTTIITSVVGTRIAVIADGDGTRVRGQHDRKRMFRNRRRHLNGVLL